jgi:hypothetical protein
LERKIQNVGSTLFPRAEYSLEVENLLEEENP